ncbi:hypothetical protein OO006_02885 [Prosthecochloris sp. SCSIO W1101]|nr:hypothetical protein [Prosthecochloris sp. SCSIO W1101]UZJ41959.1 hypothetical protein OO006_02885 [Prosthecochloris sp. SCSIO W1101]
MIQAEKSNRKLLGGLPRKKTRFRASGGLTSGDINKMIPFRKMIFSASLLISNNTRGGLEYGYVKKISSMSAVHPDAAGIE